MAPENQAESNISVAHPVDGTRLHAPSAERNLAAITETVRHHAPANGKALELASGTGQHVAHLARAIPGLIWQPSDVVPERLHSIDAWAAGQHNVKPALHLDACQTGWSAIHGDQSLILLVNLLHLISTPAARILLDEAAQALAPAGRLMLYGPFLRAGRATSDGDARFDASLRASDPAIGYKSLEDVQHWLDATGLRAVAVVDMPANNLTLIYERKAETG